MQGNRDQFNKTATVFRVVTLRFHVMMWDVRGYSRVGLWLEW